MSDPGSGPVFTVFTATFNRAHTLHGVYESLIPQTFRDFEWLVIDDGSTDDTRSLVERWQAEADFPIRYFYKPNGGLHTAWNTAVDLAQGRLFLRLDSDDSCTPDALQVFHDAWESIDPGRRSGFTGVCCLCSDLEGHVIGDRFPRDVFDSDSNALRFKYRVLGEKWGFHRIEVVREYRFPELPGVSYVPESILWGRIADHYQERFINKVLRVYSQDPTEQSRLSLAPRWKNSSALALREQSVMNERLRWFFYDPKYFFKAAANFARSSWHAGDGVSDQWRSLSGVAARALWLAMLPVGWVLYRRDARSRRGT
jgi:glycosyltransferase involved in cell wall biosynthesis